MVAMTDDGGTFGWRSEAHRLLLGANRSRNGERVAGNDNSLTQLATETRSRVAAASVPMLQVVSFWVEVCALRIRLLGLYLGRLKIGLTAYWTRGRVI
jgi:hypothetical protein